MMSAAAPHPDPHAPPARIPLPSIEAVPAELRGLKRWLLWRYVQRDGRWTKMPLRTNGAAASSTDPSTWSGLDEALEAARRLNCGVGIALGKLSDGTYLAGVDLDSAESESGTFHDWAYHIISNLDSYTETSVSGNGVHILCRCTGLPGPKRRRGPVEIYLEGRFFVFTGQALNTRGIEERTAQLAEVYRKVFGDEEAAAPARVVTMPPPEEQAADAGELTPEDRALLDAAFAMPDGGELLQRMWQGDKTLWGPDRLFPSQSEVDLSFTTRLMHLCDGDVQRVDRIFRHSGLMRPKWLGRGDYRSRTLQLAHDSYKGSRASETPPAREIKPKVEVVSGESWTGGLLLTKAGPRAVLYNALLALRRAPELQGVVSLDTFRQETYLMNPAPWTKDSDKLPRPWTQHDDLALTEWLHSKGIFVVPEVTGQAVELVAKERSFDSLIDYLGSLRWDGVPRLDRWAVDYMNAEENEYTRAVSSRWMISAVARAYRPGIKSDHVLIAEGGQGLKKSTAFSILGGEFFTDEIADLGTKDAALQVAGVWILEIGELDSIARREMSAIKAFLSRQVDRFRPPYGRRVISVPRRCVFCGSTNDPDYLRDPSGARRFWPIRCHGPARVDELAEVRDQLWAEALHRYRKGVPWWLDDPALVALAEDQQAARYESDPWETKVLSWASSRGDVSVHEVMQECLEKPVGQWIKADRNRICAVLRAAGWTQYRARLADGSREWRFRMLKAKEDAE